MCYSALMKRDLKELERDLAATPLAARFAAYAAAGGRDPKKFPALHSRIFPGHYGPVVHAGAGGRVAEPMRYGAYPPPTIAHPERYTTFNARRDNLSSPFWRPAFLQNHGAVILRAFYEWVAVPDLLAAGVVTLADVRAAFARQADERRRKLLAAGKKAKPTPTELKDPLERRIIIEFRPLDGEDLLVPTIFSPNPFVGPDAADAFGFAIVTDDPPPEISLAGHDRCPVVLPAEALAAWLSPANKTAKQLAELLMRRRRTTFGHALPQAA